MRCLAVCQGELVIRMLDEILLPGFEVEFIVENKPAARRLHETGVTVFTGDPRRAETWIKADLGPSTCVIIEDNGRRNPKKILDAVRDAGGTLIYVLGIGAEASDKRAQGFRTEFPDVTYLAMSELFGGPLLTGFSRSPATVTEYDRVAMVDVQPHYFGGLVDRVDLVIDHHPEQPGYTTVFKDIRPDYGSTSTILTEHLRAVDANISERTATAMLYAIKS